MKRDDRINLLPIGSIVLLNNATKRIMVMGFSPIIKNSKEEVEKKEWDYCGCLYPEGLLAPDQILVFDHSQIKEIYFKGFQDDEQIDFKKRYIEYLNEDDEKKNHKKVAQKRAKTDLHKMPQNDSKKNTTKKSQK